MKTKNTFYFCNYYRSFEDTEWKEPAPIEKVISLNIIFYL